MKSKSLFTIGLFSLFFFHAPLLMGDTISENSYFKSIVGNWVGEGDLITADARTIHVREVWEGKLNDDGTFSITGSRNFGDEKQDFVWTFSYNTVSEVYECEYTFTGLENPMRFEVSVTDSKMEMKAPFGEPGSELSIVNIVDGKALKGTVILTSSVGIELLKGTVTHSLNKE